MSSRESSIPMSTMASALLFGTILFATAAIGTRAYLMGDSRPFQMAQNPRSSALDVRSLGSVFTLLYHTSVFGFILFYAYICEYHPPFAHMNKNYDADQFFFLTALLFVVSYFTMKVHVKPAAKVLAKAKESSDELTPEAGNGRANSNDARQVAEANDATEVLNRDQTEEWKGWMQFMFLLYHYYHAEEVYNSIRIMITCYVWMTGFGNFSFFYLKADYGIVRVLQMLWRLNFLVCFLCLTQGTTYILYYICLLHTYFFFLVYVTMRIKSDLNYSKWGIRIKLGIVGLIIFLVWDTNFGLFQFVHFPFLGTTSMLGAPQGSMWEWYFRSTLDHWSTYLGMIFALNFPITSLFFRKLEAQSTIVQVLAKGSMGLALLCVFGAWVMGPFREGKINYNATNAYFGFIPLITYIYFRNLTPTLRGHTFDLLHQIGKTTLETYLMQHHIWLTSNAKSLLTLIPGWPKMNFLIVTVIYVVASRRLYQLTLYLRAMMLPDDKNACFRNLAGLAAVIISCCAFVYALDTFDVLSLEVVGLLSLIGGVILYRFILSNTVDSGSASESSQNADGKVKQSLGGLAPMWMGAGLVVLVGIGWHHMILTGASKVQPLPATCSRQVNEGSWISLNGCDEGVRHAAKRSGDIYTESLCTPTDSVHLWAWDDVPSTSLCRFTQRNAKAIVGALSGHQVLFVGDSMTRYLYNSFSRQMGKLDAGQYNATAERHVDIDREIGNARVDFRWAPYINNQTSSLKSVNSNNAPSVVVMGGGAWDRLWKYPKDRDAVENSLQSLASEMRRVSGLGVPVVWMVPTTINSAALPDDAKRGNIAEKDMVIFRELYKTKGILSAADLVIDGTKFTASRVGESYDGVHYPLQVYSAGSQILANAMDWLVEPIKTQNTSKPREPGEMAHPYLGLMVLCFAFAGLLGFDGFMGFSYIASIFAPSVSPSGLYLEAFVPLHKKMKLPDITPTHHHEMISRSNSSDTPVVEEEDGDEEAVSLINKES